MCRPVAIPATTRSALATVQSYRIKCTTATTHTRPRDGRDDDDERSLGEVAHADEIERLRAALASGRADADAERATLARKEQMLADAEVGSFGMAGSVSHKDRDSMQRESNWQILRRGWFVKNDVSRKDRVSQQRESNWQMLSPTPRRRSRRARPR